MDQTYSLQTRDTSPVRQLVRRVAVLGAGTMGSQIAALMANHGITCDLLDLSLSGKARNLYAEEAKENLLSIRPSPLITQAALDLIHPGNFTDDLKRLKEADWVIEAVVEKLHIKRRLWADAAPHLKRKAIISTNTSAIPVASIAQGLPSHLRPQFLGTHFFNPPRYLKLMEIIPHDNTDPGVLYDVRRFAERVLSKEVVQAHDVAGFISNRIGCYTFLDTMRAMEEFGFGLDEVDTITGPAIGRPKSATFRTLDLVGIDVFVGICDNIRGAVTDRSEMAAFEVPQYLRDMMNRGLKGQKTDQGFYLRVKNEEGAYEIHTLDLDRMEYAPRQQTPMPSLSAVYDLENVRDRLRALAWADYPAAHFAWRIISRVLTYAAWMVGEVTDDYQSIDRCMKLGFGWTLGPFETWDALGVADAIKRMRNDGLDIPPWVMKIAATDSSFYPND